MFLDTRITLLPQLTHQSMEKNVILALCSVLLAFGSAGLLVVRLSTPTLKGLGWLGGAFGTGALAALLLLLDGKIPPLVAIAGGDTLVLCAFLLLHLAFLELTDAPSQLPLMGVALVCIQLSIGLFCVSGDRFAELRLICSGILIAAQVAATARLLLSARLGSVTAAIYFNVFLLVCLSALNLIGGAGVMFHLLSRAHIAALTPALYGVYIAVALGLAFGFFWMTTSKLCAELEQIASTDPLTRLYNRRIFLEWCEREKLRSERTGKPFSVLMVDLDHFKRINDRFGHGVGDSTLCAVVERMQDAVRGIDVLGRWGGEEFVVLLPGASIQSALLVAQRLRTNVEKVTVNDLSQNETAVQEPISMTVSVGLASFRGPNDEIGDMLERADVALYQAKAAGRNQVLTLA